MSDVMASINLTNTVANGSRVIIPTTHPPTGGWGSDHSLSLAFVNFILALLTFSIRYASVFWYTNKALTMVFALQLLAMTLTSAFGYSAFCCLYKVCCNSEIYLNVSLSLGCSSSLALYLAGSTFMLLSTMTIFEYGSHYFVEKMRIIERKHRSQESLVKQTIVVNSSCQGYVPHTCAMAALVALAMFKGPVMYDLVSLYRPTQDELVLTGLVFEVCYMVLWIVVWFALTVKQHWQFRILDYVPLGQPLFTIHEDQVVKNPTFDRSSGGSGDDGSNSLEMKELSGSRHRSRSGESPPHYLDALDNGSVDLVHDHEVVNSEAGKEDSDTVNLNDHIADIDCPPSVTDGSGSHRKIRLVSRKLTGHRVTFDDCVRGNDAHAGDCDYLPNVHSSQSNDASRHVSVKVDVHNNVITTNIPTTVACHGSDRGSGDAPNAKTVVGVKLRKQTNQTEDTLTREYRNSIYNKCDDLYGATDYSNANENLNNLSSPPETSSYQAGAAAHEPLPTLMSSFRDKVKESARTANTYREEHRKLQMSHYGSLERQPHEYSAQSAPIAGFSNGVLQLERPECDKRRAIVEGQVGEVTLRLNDSQDSGVRSSQLGSTISGSDNDHDRSFQHSHHPHNMVHFNRGKQFNGTAHSSLRSENCSLPSNDENEQLNVVRDRLPRQASKMDYLSIDKACQAFPRNVHVGHGTKAEIGQRDSANYSLTSSQETSSNDSVHGHGLCSQNENAPKPM